MMRKTFYIALAFTIWTVLCMPLFAAFFHIPWQALFGINLFFGSATILFWMVYFEERKPYRQRRKY